MGKNYIESSLKRFLKRKVKITLGVVVSFLITGMVAFADKQPQSIEKYYEENNLEGILTAKDNLKGLGEGVISAGADNQYIEIEKTADKTIIKNKKDSDKVIAEIDNSFISTKTAETVSTALNGMDGTNDNGVNKGILLSEQNDITENRGIILSDKNGQKGSIIKNYGIIISGAFGQNSTNIAENYGIITNKGANGQYSGNIAKNYGIIANTDDNGQRGKIVTNYGIIKNDKNFGQCVLDNEEGIGYNYGIIANNGDEGQYTTKGKAYNYGIISNIGIAGLHVNGDGEIYNYGLIANNGDYAMSLYSQSGKGKAQNYGVIENKTGKVFYGKVDNYGLVILKDKELQDGGLGTGKNKGILLDKNYNVIGEDIKVFKSGETVTNFGGKNSFGENITKGYVFNETVNIDNTENKVIGAVVSDNSKLENETVFKYNNIEKNELFLSNTIITGYFKQDGTLLDVETGNLTLGEGTNITAVKGDLSLDVTAVKLGDKGKVTIIGDAKINGKIEGGTGTIHFADSKGVYNVESGNVEIGITGGNTESDYQKYFNVTLTSTTPDKDNQTSGENINYIKLSTENAVVDLKNTLVIDSSVKIGKNDKGYSIYDTNTTNENAELELTVNSIHDLAGNVLLGAGKDTFIVKSQDPHGIDDENHKDKFIDLGAGEDKFIAEGTVGKNIFGYNVVNAETIELKNGAWGDWDKAGKISFTDTTKADKQPNLVLGNDTTMHITLNATGEHGSDFADYVGTKLGLNHAVITGTGNKSVVKYQIDEKGLDKEHLNTKKYSFGEGVSYKDSPIFNIDSNKEDGVNISLKTASDLGFSGQYRLIYDAYINQVIADGKVNSDVINKINSMNNQNEMIELVKGTDINGKAYYTAGSVVTKDIVNSYVSSVEDFSKRAGKGEWLAQGKYINSDTEFDGGSRVKGYDGDITGTVGMIEYGLTENTSYGAVFGQGDAEMDINGGGKLDGDNTYAGLYMKHRTANGIELVGNIGYIKSNMDSDLRNDFNTASGNLNVSGSTTEKGTADSSAVVLSLKGRKDYRVTDTVKLQPVLGARVTFINQDKAENPEMNFTIAEQDIIVVEGTAGMGVAKEFALSQGKLELNAGAEYTFAAANSNNDAEYTLFEGDDYQATHIKMDDVDAAENTGTVYAGFDYEHENGVGFNGKYEMMWSDKGDDSRITAGISYRF